MPAIDLEACRKGELDALYEVRELEQKVRGSLRLELNTFSGTIKLSTDDNLFIAMDK